MKSTACSRIDVIHEDTIFNANNPSGIIYMVVTICKRIFLTFVANCS